MKGHTEFMGNTLSPAAIALRVVHAGIAVVEIVCLGRVWHGALTGRRDRTLGVAIAILAAEGVGLVIGRGNCPLGPLQREVGDPVPLFELVLPPRAAKAAVPVLTVIAVIGVAINLARMIARRGLSRTSTGRYTNLLAVPAARRRSPSRCA